MPRGYVLVIAKQLDPSADLVVQALNDREVPVLRFDLAEFPQAITLAAEHESETPGWLGELVTGRRAALLGEIRAVYHRRPGLPQPHPEIHPVHQEWARTQALVGLTQILASLPVVWMHHPDTYRACAHKPGQLVAAASVGLRVPDRS